MTLLNLGDLAGIPFHVDSPCLDLEADWHADDAAARRDAAARCNPCPILDRCLDAALERGEVFGVWGGVDLESTLRQHGHIAGRDYLRNTAPTSTGANVTS